jgi:hypothetical protein
VGATFQIEFEAEIVPPVFDDLTSSLIHPVAPDEHRYVTVEFMVNRNQHDEDQILHQSVLVARYLDLFGNEYTSRQEWGAPLQIKRTKEAGSD